MKRRRWLGWGTIGCAVATVIACSSSENASDDDIGPGNDSGSPDTSTNDGNTPADASPADAGVDAGPFCNVSPCAIDITTGGHQSCALLSDGTVRCWGGNESGQLGYGTDVDASAPIAPAYNPTPTPVTGLTGAIAIGGGGFYDNEPFGHTCAMNGTAAVCWGINATGELGRGDASTVTRDPAFAPVVLGHPISQLSVGVLASCALEQDGDVACWGYNIFHQISAAPDAIFATAATVPAPVKFTAVAVGVAQTCAIATDKTAWCWGFPNDGQLGHAPGDGGPADLSPSRVTGLANVKQIAGGYLGTCALTEDGIAHCWGAAAALNSQLGRGDIDAGAFDPTPASVVMPTGVTFAQIVPHFQGFCALDTTGGVWCWGTNVRGAEGRVDGGDGDGGPLFPAFVPSKIDIANVDRIASMGGSQHICALVHGGSVKCWGFNGFGQLGGDPDGGVQFSTTPVDVHF